MSLRLALLRCALFLKRKGRGCSCFWGVRKGLSALTVTTMLLGPGISFGSWG